VGTEALLLFDGDCGLCHGLVRFLAQRDHARRLRFAPLGSAAARAALAGSGLDSSGLDEAVMVLQPGTREAKFYRGPRAALTAIRFIPGGWRWLALALDALPEPLLAWGYRWIARRRYRWFGGVERCAIDPGLLAGRIADSSGVGNGAL
jgi:predicted DCC family thiol-disulfide oxidoreductase YuxK